MFIVYVIINIIHIWFADQPQKIFNFMWSIAHMVEMSTKIDHVIQNI